MNWIPKGKAGGRKPTDKDKIKEYFRKNRAPLSAIVYPAQDETPQRSISTLPESRGTSQCSGNQKVTEFHRTSPQSRASPASSEPRYLPSVPLCQMNLKNLSRTIGHQQVAVSSELVHLEIMKKMHSYRPREPSPEVTYVEEPEYLNNDNEVTYQSDPGHDEMDPAIWNLDHIQEDCPTPLPTDSVFHVFDMSIPFVSDLGGVEPHNMERPQQRTELGDMPDRKESSAKSTRMSDSSSSTAPNYWDLTAFGRLTPNSYP